MRLVRATTPNKTTIARAKSNATFDALLSSLDSAVASTDHVDDVPMPKQNRNQPPPGRSQSKHNNRHSGIAKASHNSSSSALGAAIAAARTKHSAAAAPSNLHSPRRPKMPSLKRRQPPIKY